MQRALSYPWIYLVEFVLWLVFGICLIGLVAFLSSTPVAELGLHGKALPGNWEAAYLNHGKYLRGFLVSRHPLLFGFTTFLFVSAFVAQWIVDKKIRLQVRTGGNARVRGHRISRILFALGGMAFIWYLTKSVFVGVLPA